MVCLGLLLFVLRCGSFSWVGCGYVVCGCSFELVYAVGLGVARWLLA